ncbi:MAG: hypothetical protein IT371_21725 [Deltaproteobacteria bacterium]|nr:hypothetical protein [Deltaproteobacteria bacterium]
MRILLGALSLIVALPAVAAQGDGPLRATAQDRAIVATLAKLRHANPLVRLALDKGAAFTLLSRQRPAGDLGSSGHELRLTKHQVLLSRDFDKDPHAVHYAARRFLPWEAVPVTAWLGGEVQEQELTREATRQALVFLGGRLNAGEWLRLVPKIEKELASLHGLLPQRSYKGTTPLAQLASHFLGADGSLSRRLGGLSSSGGVRAALGATHDLRVQHRAWRGRTIGSSDPREPLKILGIGALLLAVGTLPGPMMLAESLAEGRIGAALIAGVYTAFGGLFGGGAGVYGAKEALRGYRTHRDLAAFEVLKGARTSDTALPPAIDAVVQALR